MVRIKNTSEDLRQRQQHRRIPDAEAVLIQRIERQIVQERVAEGIGYLQRRPKQHGEQEKQRHAPLAKQHQRIQPQHAHPAL